ncbi:hypothetical protein EN846_33900, partial [Mesorhizobium sp. M4B.F.Ca.ET.203.01.1.1]
AVPVDTLLDDPVAIVKGHNVPGARHDRIAAQKLARHQGMKELDRLETSLIRLVEEMNVAAPESEVMKEFAIELIVSTLRNVREHPDAKQDLEEIEGRRAEGRSEDPDTLEEQLQSGLEDSFP